MSFISLSSAPQHSEAKGQEARLEQDWRLQKWERVWSHTQPVCIQEGNFTLGAGLLNPLTDIPSPIPSSVHCLWACLKPVTNLDLPLRFTSLICREGRLKYRRKTNLERNYVSNFVLDRAQEGAGHPQNTALFPCMSMDGERETTLHNSYESLFGLTSESYHRII